MKKRKPRVSILDSKFAYTDAANTNIRATFERIRREQDAAEKARKDQAEATASKVRAIGERAKA